MRTYAFHAICLSCLLLNTVAHGAALGEEWKRPPTPPQTNAVPNEVLPSTPEQEAAVASNGPHRAQTLQDPLLTPNGHTWVEIIFSCAVLAFGLALVLIQSILLLRNSLSSIWAFKLMGLTIVITAGLFAIPAGFSQNQMTPLMGLLGAVAGYILGKDNSHERAPERKEPETSSRNLGLPVAGK